MTCSMTAFSRQQSEHDWGLLAWEIRSVNHRYLEPSLRLPDSLRHLEGRLRELLRGALSRGKVEAQLKFNPQPGSAQSLHLNAALVDQLIQVEDVIRGKVSNPAPVNTLELLKWPGVIQEQEQDTGTLEEAALALFRRGLDDLISQRRREGAELEEMIRQRLQAIHEIVAGLRAAMPEILQRQRERISNQFEDLKLDTDPTRLEQEVALVVQKADIHEEVDRLDTHVREVARVLKQDEPAGRRLDFLMQELNREANTICSKAVVTETTLGAVELKVLIEQMREQIQNIE